MSEFEPISEDHIAEPHADARRPGDREPAADPTGTPSGTAGPVRGAGGEGGEEASFTVDDVMDALSNVIDPELGLDFVELGLIYGVEIQGRNVHITFTLTTPGCPIGPQVTDQIQEFVGEIEGVGDIQSEMVFMPPWSPERMSDEAKFALGY